MNIERSLYASARKRAGTHVDSSCNNLKQPLNFEGLHQISLCIEKTNSNVLASMGELNKSRDNRSFPKPAHFTR